MFLLMSVILFTGGIGFPAYITGHMTNIQGVCLQGDFTSGGGLLPWGVAYRGGWAHTPPRQESGWYASYWNAFLFQK